jgi:hypothetical protein
MAYLALAVLESRVDELDSRPPEALIVRMEFLVRTGVDAH